MAEFQNKKVILNPHNKKLYDDLSDEIAFDNDTENERRKYPWIDDSKAISYWDIERNFYSETIWFHTLLDVSPLMSGWEVFAENLGLKSDEIEWCKKWHKEGPTAEVLKRLKRSEKHDLSLYEVLNCLIEMERFDLMSRLPWQDMIGKLLNTGTALLTESTLKHPLSPARVDMSMVSSQPIIKPSLTPKKIKTSILLLHAADSLSIVNRIVPQLRDDSRGYRIGVLLLNEQNGLLIRDPYNTLHKWFLQVKYIVPILSPRFLKQIQNQEDEKSDELIYNRFLYRLLLDQYCINGSQNLRCRALLPEQFKTEIERNPLISSNGLFMISFGCAPDKIEAFAQILLE